MNEYPEFIIIENIDASTGFEIIKIRSQDHFKELIESLEFTGHTHAGIYRYRKVTNDQV